MILPVSRDEISVRQCLTSGQVFRWKEVAPDQWVGVDGDHGYRIEQYDDRLVIETTADESEVRRLFHLEVPMAQVRRELTTRGPELAPMLDQVGPIRLLRPSSFIEVLFSFLCTANNHLSRIETMVETLGWRGESFGPDWYRFPDLATLASLSESDLRREGFGYRAPRIPAVARSVAEWPSNEVPRLRNGTLEDARVRLMTLPGVGPKLADCVALYGLHHATATPTDTHLWQAMGRTYWPELLGKSLTEGRRRLVHEFLVERFGVWAGWAHLVLYRAHQTRRRE